MFPGGPKFAHTTSKYFLDPSSPALLPSIPRWTQVCPHYSQVVTSLPVILPLANTSHCCCPGRSSYSPIPNSGLFAQKQPNTCPRNMELANCSPRNLLQRVPSKNLLVLQRHLVHENKKNLLFLPFIHRQGRAIQLVRHSYISYIRGKSPHLTLMILGRTRYICLTVNF